MYSEYEVLWLQSRAVKESGEGGQWRLVNDYSSVTTRQWPLVRLCLSLHSSSPGTGEEVSSMHIWSPPQSSSPPSSSTPSSVPTLHGERGWRDWQFVCDDCSIFASYILQFVSDSINATTNTWATPCTQFLFSIYEYRCCRKREDWRKRLGT